MKNFKALTIVLFLLSVLIIISCDMNIPENSSQKPDIFSMSFVYSDDSDTAPTLLGTVSADTGNIFKKIVIDVTNLTNEKQYLGEYVSTIKIRLSNGHQYTCKSFYESIMPEQTKRIEIYFEVIQRENIDNAIMTFTHLMEYSFNDTYELRLPLSAEPDRTDYQLKKDIIGTWEYIDPDTQEAEGFFSFFSASRCVIVNDSGWTFTNYSINQGNLTFESNSLNPIECTFSMLLSTNLENELIAFSDSSIILEGSGKLHTYQKISNYEIDTFPYSMNEEHSRFLRDRTWFTSDEEIGFLFNSDGTGYVFLKSPASDSYTQDDITWRTENQLITITVQGSPTPLIEGLYAFVSDDDSVLFLFVNDVPTLICDLFNMKNPYND